MSEQIKHECGIAFIRLLQPLEFYQKKYGTPLYGLNKLYLLMEKQHNRGQDGAGVANIKLNVAPGNRYISRYRSVVSNPIQDIFNKINGRFEEIAEKNPENLKDVSWLHENVAFTGELLLGHLRYGTYGKNSIEYCHPFLRQNNWMSRNLVLAGNFNLTNVDELFQQLIDIGQHPKERSDTVTMIEKIGHFLDEENGRLYHKYKESGMGAFEISKTIAEEIDIQRILVESCKKWDGGYVITGMMGHGDAFILRDPSGIRPAFYYQDEEVIVATSERPAIQTAFNIDHDNIKEITPGHALVIKKSGALSEVKVREPLEKKACSFERIYFSRGTDIDICNERKELGRTICPTILECIDFDVKNSVFSFIPNTAETAFYGMVRGIEAYLDKVKKDKIKALGPNPDPEKLGDILSIQPKVEKVAIKDAKLRTFITDDQQRDDLVSHVYDITYGTVRPGKDNLIVIDDSIVRGTTLEQSILRILDRLGPKKIVIVSSAPQIRYPDCYGIDMAKLGDFIAFRAAIALLKDTLQENIIDDVYERCKAQEGLPKEEIINHVKDIYRPFTPQQVSDKITELLKPKGMKADVKIIYQSLEGLHKACPKHTGDWYFSGDYPTAGGNKVVNKAFINYVEGKNVRAY
jgi:amidophosphoribosyltransferase